MTFRSRSGGPIKNRKPKKQTHTRKLHHPSSSKKDENEEEKQQSDIPSWSIPLSSCLESAQIYNPPDSEILSILNRSLHDTLSSDEFIPTIQKIKGLLYDKKWLEVFCGSEFILESYAGRWVPSRACCFREVMDKLVGNIFTGEEKGLEDSMAQLDVDDDESEEDDEEGEDQKEGEDETDEERDDEDSQGDSAEGDDEEGVADSQWRDQAKQLEQTTPCPQETHHILSLGGGAGSELLAITALIRSTILTRPHSHPKFSWTGIDIGNWYGVLEKIENAVRIDWKIDSNLLDINYIKGDLLSLPINAGDSTLKVNNQSDTFIDLPKLLIDKPPKLITLFFTLTELLTQSRPRTLSILDTITQNTSSGTYFLVIDSASDISDFSLGKDGRKYPVYMIIDTLLTAKGRGWEKVRAEDSRWFRFSEGVGAGWKVKLENTRYWYRLYRRI
ncbi:uncharacterized protein I206_107407 [Kwoniella pini CBS 10737]|uniref:Cytoplasmic protein n=1 Tax=Kwoniella pini CBS 10737 TaxID=1296096 RepID=A0A1B9HX89_9TREE|nr:uncharacterized protein I206_05733 [Kwoniella pini CBS 10737]OCF47871.1 hypothetical protein I206_05733 [Kwoniella pini CBS 10737]